MTVISRFILLLTITAIAWQWSAAHADSFTLLSQNANRFFDNVDNNQNERILTDAQFSSKISRLAKRIGEAFELPEIIALQEIESQHLLQTLADRLNRLYGIRYQAFMIPGQDISGINLGFLVQSQWQVESSSQLLRAAMLASSLTPVYTRPPLKLRLCQRNKCLTIINVHLRSMRGLNSATRGPWVADKRLQQATLLARWIDRYQRQKPSEPLLLVGDFNALTPADEQVDVRGVLLGHGDNPRTQLIESDLIQRDLVDLTLQIPAQRRYSYLFKDNKQQLDYLLASQGTGLQVRQIGFSRIDYRLSDHAALFAELGW